MTEVVAVEAAAPEPDAIARAAGVLRRGGLVAFPTETVYGLGANALDPAAVQRIFEAKGRPPDDPIIVHLASAGELDRVAREVPQAALALGATFWPGPLTLVVAKRDAVPPSVTAGLDTVAVRVPAHPVALALIREAGVPVAAPSANRFGHASPTTARHVLDDLEGRIDLVLDAGPTPVGVESTVVDLSGPAPTILRPGGVPREDVERIAGAVAVRDERPGDARRAAPQRSPGLLAEHYAVAAELILVESTGAGESHGPARPAVLTEIARLARRHVEAGRRVGLLVADEDAPVLADAPGELRTLGPAADVDAVARELFAAMRALEAAGVEVIVARDFGTEGLGLAIRDRLRRAASEVVVVP